MPPRVYTTITTIGDTSIYQVIVNPNGILTADVGSIAILNDGAAGLNVGMWQNTNGGTAWSMTSERNTRKSMGPVFTGMSLHSVPAGSSLVIPFTVPEACTLKQLLLTSLSTQAGVAGSDGVTGYIDLTMQLIVTSIAVDAGPDSGGNLISGNVPARIFSTQVLDSSPDLDIRCPAGSTVSVTILNLNATFALQVFPTWTYTPGVNMAQASNTLIGPAALAPFSPGVGVGTSVMFINAAPLAVGDDIEVGTSSNNATLTGLAGARTPGSDDFDASLGTVLLLQAEIVAAFNDGANSFAGTWVATPLGVDRVAFTSVNPGLIGNLYNLIATAATPADLTVSSPVFTGGTSLVTASAFPVQARDVRLHNMYLVAIVGEGADVSQYCNPTELRVGGAPVVAYSGQSNGFMFDPKWPGDSVNIDEFVGAGVAIDLDVENTG